MTNKLPRVELRSRYGVWAAGLGAMIWILFPWTPVGTPPTPFSLEHVFLFLLLVVAPLGYRLLSGLMHESEGWSRNVFRYVAMVQPIASMLATAAFLLPPGSVAGALAAAWVAVAVATAVCGLSRVRQGWGANYSNVSLIAAHVFLAPAASWLLMSLAGVSPGILTPLRVVLAVVHFHYTGFAFQILLGATGMHLPTSMPRLAQLHRIAAIVSILGIPMIAAGNMLAIDLLRLAGVSVQVLVSLALTVTLTAVAVHEARPAPRLLLMAAAISLAGGMAIAGVYGATEFAGKPWLEVPTMVLAHGLLNALGFTLCGMVGHLLASDG